jgi:hypothetical protein
MHDDQNRTGRSTAAKEPRLVDAKWAITGGALVALFGLGVMALVGSVGDYEARLLLEAALPTIRFLASSVITGSATVLALMLTILGISGQTEVDLNAVHYRRIVQVSVMSVVALIASLLLLMFLTFPLEEAQQLRDVYDVVYFVVLGISAAVGGMMVTVVLMLLNAIREMVAIFHPSATSRIVDDAG